MNFVNGLWNKLSGSLTTTETKPPVNDLSDDALSVTSGAGEFLDVTSELDEDWGVVDIEQSVETEKVSTDSTNIRAVTPPSLCGMEGWEVDSNDPDLFADEQEIHMAEVLGDDGCRESAVENDAADSRSHEQGTCNTKDDTDAAGLFAFTPTPGSPVSFVESSSPPLETSHSWGYRRWPQYPVYLHSPTRKTTLPEFSKNPVADSPPVAKRKLNVHHDHIEQVGPADKWGWRGSDFIVGDEYQYNEF